MVKNVSEFQFHKGTIRTLKKITFVPNIPDFNSIKVQLEPDGEHILSLTSKFQFHKGTIRTFERFRENRLLAHFNSIKVQLEHTYP